VWNYGRFRGFFLRRLSTTRREGIYAVPAAFVAAHAAVALALTRRNWRLPALVAAGAYAAVVAASAIVEARRERVHPATVAAGIYLTHLTYGTASIVGWLRGGRANR
jgi:hypothetical protein